MIDYQLTISRNASLAFFGADNTYILFNQLIDQSMIIKSLLTGIFLHLCVALFAQSTDDAVKVKQVVAYGEDVLQISYDGTPAQFGVFTVKDAQGNEVYRVDPAELAPSPYYFSVGLEGFPRGTFVFGIRTSAESHQTTFTIQ